jgi:formylglycine-generating enzyme
MVATLLRQIVAGVAAIHAAGIVHRDIKPQNIVILPGTPERVVVADFGLARVVDPTSVRNAETGPFLIGTLDYMSREQIEGKPPGPGFDIYALGVVIFEMLTGRKPFVGATALATALERLNKPAPPPSHFLPDLDRRWDELVARCLTLNPERRFATVEQIVPPPDTGGRSGRRGRRAQLAMVMAGMTAVVGVLAIIVVQGWRREPAPPAFPPESLLAAELAARPPGGGAPRQLRRVITASGCTADMVAVAGRFCIDRFEAATVDDVEERPLSPFHPPWAPLAAAVQGRWQKRLAEGKAGSNAELARLEPFQTEDRWRPRAISARFVVPQGYVNRPLAATACASAGKRLCTEEEWRTACRGEDDTKFPYGQEYQGGVCNIFREAHPALVLYGVISGPLDDPRLNRVGFQGRMLLQKTGDLDACKSRWGDDAAYDMVGNLDEWVASSDSSDVVYRGGFYARDSKEGCDYRNDHHRREGGSYFNFSTGFRCCDSWHPPSSAEQDVGAEGQRIVD